MKGNNKRVIYWFQKLIRHIMSKNALLNCHFQVEWAGTRIGFIEVSGLEIQYDVVEQHDGASPDYSSQKMPGRPRYSNIVLKRGIIPGDNEFYTWIKTIKLNTVEKRDLVICLLDEEHNPAVVWKVKNAFPVRLTGPVLNAFASEVAIETLELAHEGITIE
jgi:phage tail-like protein